MGRICRFCGTDEDCLPQKGIKSNKDPFYCSVGCILKKLELKQPIQKALNQPFFGPVSKDVVAQYEKQAEEISKEIYNEQ